MHQASSTCAERLQNLRQLKTTLIKNRFKSRPDTKWSLNRCVFNVAKSLTPDIMMILVTKVDLPPAWCENHLSHTFYINYIRTNGPLTSAVFYWSDPETIFWDRSYVKSNWKLSPDSSFSVTGLSCCIDFTEFKRWKTCWQRWRENYFPQISTPNDKEEKVGLSELSGGEKRDNEKKKQKTKKAKQDKTKQKKTKKTKTQKRLFWAIWKVR